jgi:MFS family permease
MSNSQETNLAADENNDIPTTEEQLEAIGRGKFIYIVILVLASFNIAYGMEILVTNLCFRAMPRTEWGMTDQDRAHLVSVAYIGFIIGAMIAGFSADKVGRKPLIFLHATLFFPFALWSALATNLSSVYTTRFVVGIAVGITLPVSVSLISELAPPSQRGWMILAVPSIGFFTGQILVLLVGIVAMEEDIECDDNCGWWRWVFAAGLIPDTIGFLLSLAFVPESPRFLLLHGRVAEAEAVVSRIAAANGAEARLRAGGRVRPLDPQSVALRCWSSSRRRLRATCSSSPWCGPCSASASTVSTLSPPSSSRPSTTSTPIRRYPCSPLLQQMPSFCGTNASFRF